MCKCKEPSHPSDVIRRIQSLVTPYTELAGSDWNTLLEGDAAKREILLTHDEALARGLFYIGIDLRAAVAEVTAWFDAHSEGGAA